MIRETLGFPDVPVSPEADATNGGAVVPLERRHQPDSEELDPGNGPDDDDPGPKAA